MHIHRSRAPRTFVCARFCPWYNFSSDYLKKIFDAIWFFGDNVLIKIISGDTGKRWLEDLKKKLHRRRRLSDQNFSTLYNDEFIPLAESLDINIKLPKIVKNQNYRNNTDAENPKVCLRHAIYIPLLDHVIQDLESRFSDDVLQLYNFSFLFPTTPTEVDREEIQSSVASISKKYCHFFNQPEELIKQINGELSHWYGQWARSSNTGELTAVELLINVIKIYIFPCISCWKYFSIYLSQILRLKEHYPLYEG